MRYISILLLSLMIHCCHAIEPMLALAPGDVNAKNAAGKSILGENRVPQMKNGRLTLPPLAAPTTELTEIGNGVLPENEAAITLNEAIPLPEGNDRLGFWSNSTYRWRAACSFHYPLYFEDAMLERHGHRCYCVQPVVSGARFFTSLATLPYLATIDRPCECNYTLGSYRPGSCAPCLTQGPPVQRDAIINQGLWTAGAFLLIP